MFTKKQLMSLLDNAGVTYAPKANLATLQALCAEHNIATQEPGDTDTGNEATPPASDAPVAPEQPVAPQPDSPPADAATDRHTGGGLKIEKDRPEQHGIKRPSAGGKCRAVWDALDGLATHVTYNGDNTTNGPLGVAGVTSKMVKQLALDEGWNPNNASIEFYQWRKYNGVTGRTAKTD